MRLKEIVISGFKSFPKKTTFVLKEGITTFVGPNGCGKTNIIDAIKWGLGETSVKTLRADRLEDLIFSGTQSRPQVGMAEVKLLFENNGGLPIDYEEVEVKRRYFRSGEGTFLINNTPCRLRDIQNLFANSALRSSILDQQIIEDFLISDSEIRRELLESIAGIKRYRQDRKEALNKLNQVENSLEKIEIILNEKRKVMRSLGREANRAKRFHKFRDELKEMVVLNSKAKLYFIETKLDENNKEKTILTEKLDKLAKKLRSWKSEIEISEEELNLKRKEYVQKNRETEDLQKNILTLRENKARIEGELKIIIKILEDIPENINDSIDETEHKIEKLKDYIDKISLKIPEYETKINKFEDELNEISSIIENQKGKDLSIKIKMEEQQSRINSIKEYISEYEKSLQDKNIEIKKLEDSIASNKKEFEKNTDSINKLESETQKKDDMKSTLLRNIQNEKSELNRIEKEIQFYESRALELSKGMKIIKEKMQLPILSENINVKKGYEKAIEAILGDFLNGLIGSIEDVKKAIDILNEESSKGGIFIIGNVKNEDEYNGIIKSKYLHLIKNRLSKYKIARNVKEALEKSINQGGFWITPDGDVIEDKFISLSKGKEGVLERRAKEEELRKDAKNKQTKIKSLEEKNEELDKDISNLKNEVTNIKEKREKLINEQSKIEFNINRLNYEIESIKKEWKSDEKEINKLKKSIDDLRNEKKEVEKTLNSKKAEYSTLDQELEELNKKLITTQKERESKQIKLRELKEILNKLKDALLLLSERDKMEQNRKEIGKEIKIINSKFEQLRSELSDLSNELDKNEQKISKERKDYLNEQEAKSELERKIDNLKMEITKWEYQKENLLNEVFREFGETITGEEIELEEDFDEKITELREKIESLKPINPLAIQQHAEKKEELDKLKKEHNDLIDSRKDINESINEIDKKATKQFKETFADIKNDFQSIYEQLSPGGIAEIRLTNENILESDIEVWIQPGGKKLKRMELFSTGEKTLAAVALLLAIMKKRQSPIYIMDEIDAPLDENNIERFITIIKDFSKNSQILLVTHNRRTMEESHCIYGVTMEEKGISKALSLDVKDIAVNG
jgi:chromosome segregation protein